MRRPLIISMSILGVALVVFAAYRMRLSTTDVLPPPSPVTAERAAELPPRVEKQLSKAERDHVLDGPFAVFTSTEAMPWRVRRAFAAITGEPKFSLANPGQDYQATDVIQEPGLPRRRLLFAGATADKWFIHYEMGGRGHGYSVVVFGFEPDTRVRFLWGGAGCHGAKDLEELRQMIVAGRFSDDEPYFW